ncbi:protein of unknown function [Desulfacinum infernum DSM 9756]|jgi:hypothetical protein|uniref:DUF4390 domain-containing protein n=1 Tax=Desulfacinum infernum DSM 9756 TaxID=1121391 RepID=A0A1M4TQU7_9BACT|nr:DUF4390 domain-containing protein [Desulfacinum infernum]SHE46823.1 protein of unknown function [Desulfacinum infernum DSM 9756]
MRQAFFFAALFTAIFCTAPVGTEALARNKADIADLAVYPDPPNLKVRFRIDNCFNDEMMEAIKSGVPAVFRILVVLEKEGLPLLRDRLVDVSFEHSIRYDTLHGQYHVKLTEHPSTTLTTKDFEKAKKWMSEVEDVPVIPLWRLPKGQEYQVRVKAELSKVQLPFFLRYVFFFVSLWDFETDWAQASFVH